MANKPTVEARRLKGFQDYLPEIMQTRLVFMQSIREIASKSGFQPVGTPALEYAEVLLGQGVETDKQMFRFTDNGDRDVGMRFDLTVPFARFVAEHQGTLIFPFKRLQMGDVWRAEKPQKGRYREFTQCDLDIIGVDSLSADVEVLTCLQKILTQLNCGQFQMKVGNRNILSALIQTFLPHAAKNQENDILIALDKLDKIGVEKVIDLICQIPFAESHAASQLVQTLKASRESLDEVKNCLREHATAIAEIARLEQTVQIVKTLTAKGHGSIDIDLSVARGLGYYTGIVYETTLIDLPEFGSISSGGRYNNLTSRFSSQELAGVGGSIGLDRLMAALQELNRIPQLNQTEVYIAIANDEAVEYAFNIADQLREAQITTDISLKTNKVSNQFKLAARMNCKTIITVGGQEKDNQVFSIKHLQSNREERNLDIKNLITIVKDYIN